VTDSVTPFYDAFAPDYHLAYGGEAAWRAAVVRQGEALDGVIRRRVTDATRVLDVSCGIGTQAIGLALRGYAVDGRDVSASEVSRAATEAASFGVDVSFAVGDMRTPSADAAYDVVVSCDNAVPHLLTMGDVGAALRAMRASLRPGGLLVVTMRDFDAALIERPAATLPIDVAGPPRRVLVRLHDWDDDAPYYTVRYLVLTQTDAGWTTVEHTSRYHAICREQLTAAASAAGFVRTSWTLDEVVVGGQPTFTAFAPD
jgi:SAM-dependent methyltransferase